MTNPELIERVWEGSSDVTFGCDGKPTYIQGPHDNAVNVIQTLRRSVGDGNFDYLSQIASDTGAL